MHAHLRVNHDLVGGLLTIVFRLHLRRWTPSKAVHEAARVVPVHPGRGDRLEIRQGGYRPGSKRRVLPNALGLVEPDSRLGERIRLRCRLRLNGVITTEP